MDALPDGLLRNVFAHLRYGNKKYARRVCRRFRALIDMSITRLDASHSMSFEESSHTLRGVIRMAKKCPNLSAIEIRVAETTKHTRLERLCDLLPSLTRLCIKYQGDDADVSDADADEGRGGGAVFRSVIKLPRRLNNVERLEVLVVWGFSTTRCMDTRGMRSSALKTFEMRGHVSVYSMRAFARCPRLEVLRVVPKDCSDIVDLAPLASLGSLRVLEVPTSDINIQSLQDIAGMLSQLEVLDINHTFVEDLEPLSICTSLHTLRANNLDEVKSTELFRNMPRLRELQLCGCTSVTSLQPLESCTQLTLLGISFMRVASLPRLLPSMRFLYMDHSAITDLAPLATATGLLRLRMHNCEEITDLSPLSMCTRLQWLNVSFCVGVTTLESLARATDLEDLRMDGVTRVTSLLPLAGHPKLTDLYINSTRVTTLPPLPGLVVLYMSKSWIADLAPLATAKHFATLCMRDCEMITDLSPLSGCVNLNSINISGCVGITSLKGLEGAKELHSLEMDGCTGVSSLLPLADLYWLSELSMRDCTSVDSLDGLDYCCTLSDVRMSRLPITSLKPLPMQNGYLDLFHVLHIVNCDRLTSREFEALAGFPDLRDLDVSHSIHVDSSVLLLLPVSIVTLDVRHTAVDDLSALTRLSRLETLRIGGGTPGPRSLEPLRFCPALKEIYHEGLTPLEDTYFEWHPI